ncbi:MAG: hypothetical protein ACNI26_08470 [Terasakiella sp.]
MNKIKTLPFLICLTFLVACQSTQVRSDSTEYPEVRSGKSLLIISVDKHQEKPLTILVNDKKASVMTRNDVMFVHLPAGEHRVRNSSVNSFPLDLTLRKGETAHVIAIYTDRGTYFKLTEGWNEYSFGKDKKKIEINY